MSSLLTKQGKNTMGQWIGLVKSSPETNPMIPLKSSFYLGFHGFSWVFMGFPLGFPVKIAP
jgi:hypothetical protein